MASAISSLPVPLSPVTSTLALLGPMCATMSSTSCIFGSLDTMWLKALRSRSRSRSARVSCSSFAFSMARSMTAPSVSMSSGLRR